MQRRFGAVGTYMPYFGMLCTVTSDRQRKRAAHGIGYLCIAAHFLFHPVRHCVKLIIHALKRHQRIMISFFHNSLFR